MEWKECLRFMRTFFLIFCFQRVQCQLKTPPSYSKDLETSLRTELFDTNSYSVLQRPDQTVYASLSLTLLTINDMNIKDQTLSISGYLTLEWWDSRLSWSNTSATSQDYSNVKFLFSTETYVWRPAIIIENSVEDISVISDPQIPMRLSSLGLVSWSPSGIYKVSCESDTTYYPMDYQSCSIKVSTWGYTQSEIVLLYDVQTPVELGFYSPNGEWDLLSAVGVRTQQKSRGGQTFSSLTFEISLQRRPMFHILNTLFPVALMAFLIPMVFKLPPDSGEKIGYALTVLLAYAVYLTLISDNIPSTSVTICYLSIYLALTLMYGTLSVIFVIFVLMANHMPEEAEIPGWVKSFTTRFLMTVTCWKGCCVKSCCCCCKKCKKKDSVVEVHIPSNTNNGNNKGSEVKEKPKFFVEPGQDISEEPEVEMTWKTVTTVLDRFFFFLTMFLVFATTVIIFSIIAVYYALDASSS